MERNSRKTLVAAIIGAVLGGATLDAGQLSWIVSNPVIGTLQEMFDFLLLPGLLASALSGSLWTGSVLNGILYFVLAWLLATLWGRFWGTPGNPNKSPEDPLG